MSITHSDSTERNTVLCATISTYEAIVLRHTQALERFRVLCEMCAYAGLTLKQDPIDGEHLDLKSPKIGPYNAHVQVTLSNMSDPKAELVVWGSVDASGTEYVRIMTMTCSETGWFCAINEDGNEMTKTFGHDLSYQLSRGYNREQRPGGSFWYPGKPIAFAEFDRRAAVVSGTTSAYEGLCVYDDFTDALTYAMHRLSSAADT